MLARSWQAVHITSQINDVVLFSGGLFGHDISGQKTYSTCGAQYLDDTYNTGTNVAAGGSFNFIKTNYNAYPLDGIGEHVYIDQGGTTSSNTFRQYEDWVHQACTKYEGVNTPKKTFITEFGWTTASVSQAIQDTNLVISFSTINATPYVQMAIWFQWQDNTAGGMYYGVTNSSGPKLAFPDYERFERFEGIYTNGATNAGIAAYFAAATNGQPVLGNPFDNGQSAWVHSFLNGYAQDFAGGSHSNLTVMTSTNGPFEMNDLHGIWDYYYTNNGASTFGYWLDNEYSTNGGTRQDFSLGYMTWNSTSHILWYPGNMMPPTGLTAVPANAQVTLQWNADPPATSYNVKRSTTYGGPYSTIANVVGPPTFTDAGPGEVANGTTYYYVVSGVNSLGESTNSAQANATPEAGINTLPAPWQDADIGNVGLTGASGAGGSTYTLYGSGEDIGGSGDAFHFVYQPLGGNGGIVARVKSEQNTSPLAKVGIMIRETLNTNATCVAVLLEQTNGSHLQYRPSTGSSTTDVAGPVVGAPYWLKLVRSGDSFTASAAPDGVNYVPVGNATVSMASNVFVGLAVCSHATNALNTSAFDNVSVAVPPVITSQPLPQIVNQGAAAAFSVTATSSVPVGYQWQLSGTNLAQATASSYSLTNALPSQGGFYAVVVSNFTASVLSSNALLTVRPILAVSPNGLLTWSAPCVLQSATNVAGPYSDVTGALSPYTGTNAGLPEQFFRLRNPQ
jgi:regulation of enolase protein 1 (concanavalin A-like superfamily)